MASAFSGARGSGKVKPHCVKRALEGRDGGVDSGHGELQDLILRAEGQTTGPGQFGYTVREGPGQQSPILGSAVRQLAFALAESDETDHSGESLLARLPAGGMCFETGRVEHRRKMLRPAESEGNIGIAGMFELPEGGRFGGGTLKHGCFQFPESMGGDLGQQFSLVPKMPVGGIVGNSGPAGHLAQREPRWTHLRYQVDGRFEKRFPQVSMVIWLAAWHLTRLIAENVDMSNIASFRLMLSLSTYKSWAINLAQKLLNQG